MSKKWVFSVILLSLVFSLGTLVGAVQSQSADLPPLTEPGQYGVGIKVMQFTDTIRENWTLETYIWFPADPSIGRQLKASSPLRMGAVPAKSDAPYPLIIFSHGWTGDSNQLGAVMEVLASRGFIVAAPTHHDSNPNRFELVDRPLDIELVLDGMAAITEGDLAGMIDTGNVGVMGYSQGAEAAFQMEGLLRDPVHFRNWCAEHPDLKSNDCVVPSTNRIDAGQSWPLDEIAAYRAQLGLRDLPDGSWAPFGDARIHAVMAIAPGDFPLTTDAMLAAVTTPTMIMHGTSDNLCDYEGNAVRTYTNLGTADRFLITLVDLGHDFFYINQRVPLHFAAAFFGRYLQRDETYAPYLTAEALPTTLSPALHWGVYESK